MIVDPNKFQAMVLNKREQKETINLKINGAETKDQNLVTYWGFK